MVTLRTSRRVAWIGVPILLLVAAVVALLADPDWAIPFVQSRTSATIGRKVTIEHLHLGLVPFVRVSADNVVIAEPDGWTASDPPFVTIRRLTVDVRLLDYILGRGLVLPSIALDAPKVLAAETANGTANFRLKVASGSSGPAPKIGEVSISDGEAHVVIPKLKSDFDTKIETNGQGDDAKILVNAKGRYAAQPITARMVGGALLSLRDAAHPWPVQLDVENGPTKVTLNGTLRDPVAFKGANLRLGFSGPDLSLLEHLTGFPIPKTPAYQVGGKLDLDGLQRISFTDFQGRLGSSDVEGTIQERLEDKPVVTLDLRSNRVDLADLSGFIGGVPGRANTANATPAERKAAAEARQAHTLLPDKPVSIPALNWADIHLHYHGAHILGRDMPLDDLTVAIDAVNGKIEIHPVSFGIGKGHLLANVDLAPQGEKQVRAQGNIRLENVDVSRLMAATHTFEGAGTISGVGAIDATGNSLASLLAEGNGEIKMAMAGGDLSALLVDLTGLEFGKALLSALGVPTKTQVQCFVSDLGLTNGVLNFNVMTLDTGEAITNVSGNLNLTHETIDLALKTESKHFSIGSLPTRINIGGTFKNPSIRPGAEVAARAGAAAGLGVLFAPLAILPTIQFGTSAKEDARCNDLLQQARASAGGKALPAPEQGASNGR